MQKTSMSSTERRITTEDHYPIVSHFFAPDTREIQGAVIFAPGMGIPQDFYYPMAAWLASQGYVAVTFDYRGIGQSLPGPLSGFRATIFDWARLDCVAIIETVAQQTQGRPIFWLGHSVGGQIPGLIPNIHKISKIVMIGAGSGYWRENALRIRNRVLLFWYLAVPLTTAIYGYFPGKKLRKIGDLPKGVIKQWRRWCLNPEYLIGAEDQNIRLQYANLEKPIAAFSFTDDEFISSHSVTSLLSFYTHAKKHHQCLDPATLGLKRLGHLGFFRSEHQTLWRDYLLSELRSSRVD